MMVNHIWYTRNPIHDGSLINYIPLMWKNQFGDIVDIVIFPMKYGIIIFFRGVQTTNQIYMIYIYIYMHQALPPPPSPHPPWDGSHILAPYEIFPLPPVVWWRCGAVPLPPCGVVGVWYGMLGMYGVYGRSGMACLESMVCLVGMVCMAWVVGIVWMVGMVCKSVGYGMFDMTVCMVCMVCMITMMVWHISYVRYVWYVWHVCLLLYVS